MDVFFNSSKNRVLRKPCSTQNMLLYETDSVFHGYLQKCSFLVIPNFFRDFALLQNYKFLLLGPKKSKIDSFSERKIDS